MDLNKWRLDQRTERHDIAMADHLLPPKLTTLRFTFDYGYYVYADVDACYDLRWYEIVGESSPWSCE